MKQNMKKKGIYIYGIVPNFFSPDLFRSLEDFEIYSIPWQNISAIVSDRDDVVLDYYDRESLGNLLIHHQLTIEKLMGIGFNLFIPMKLGTIMENKDDVIKILSNGYDLIMETMSKIESFIDFDLAVTWYDFPAVISEIANHPDIIALKEEIKTQAETANQIDQMKAGMLVQSLLKEKNSKVELYILDSLASISKDIKTHDLMNDQMITNSAFMISHNKKEKFEQIIDRLDKEFNGLLNFKIIGPLPCYSFYTIELKEINKELITNAKKELDLTDITSESDIKKAYMGKAKLFHPDATPETGDQEKFNQIYEAYHTLIDYSLIIRQTSKEETFSLSDNDIHDKLMLIKIKD